jgi:hypothetical protein
MAMLKKENMTWTAITDTDEYILPNPYYYHGDSNDSIQTQNNHYRETIAPPTTIYERIQQYQHQRNATHPMFDKGCISMHRLLFGFKESNTSEVQHMVPAAYNASDFTTLRWRYHAGLTNKEKNAIAKCLVDVSRVDAKRDLIPKEVNAHRPIKRLCSEKYLRIKNQESPFVAFHYTGSWEQWNYRSDFRPKRKRENFDKLYFDTENETDDSLRSWLNQFVDTHGPDLASRLLEGVGRFTRR